MSIGLRIVSEPVREYCERGLKGRLWRFVVRGTGGKMWLAAAERAIRIVSGELSKEVRSGTGLSSRRNTKKDGEGRRQCCKKGRVV